MTGADTGRTGAREAVLERIRAALADRPAAVPIPRDYERSMPGSVDLAALFVDRVDDYRATVQRVTADQLPGAIASTLATHKASRIAAPAGVPMEWFAATSAERVPDDPR